WPMDVINNTPYTPATSAFTTDGNTMALYHLDETNPSTELFDWSGNNNNGFFENDPTLGQQGEFDNAVQFAFNDAANPPVWEYAAIPNSGSLQFGSGGFTLEGWVNTTSDSRMTIMSMDGAYTLSLYGGYPKIVLNYAYTDNDDNPQTGQVSLAGSIQVPTGVW